MSVPAIVVLGLVGYFVDMARGWRVAAFGGAALLSAPFVACAVLTIITAVSIDLTTGDVALAGKNWWLSQ